MTDGRGIARFDTTVDAWRVAVSFYILFKIGHIKRMWDLYEARPRSRNLVPGGEAVTTQFVL